MIKFVTEEQEEQKPVVMTANIDGVGDFVVRANGTIVLWLTTHGTVHLTGSWGGPLTALGFQIDSQGSIKLEGEY